MRGPLDVQGTPRGVGYGVSSTARVVPACRLAEV